MFFFLAFVFTLAVVSLIKFDTPDAVRADKSDFALPKVSNSDPVPVIFGTVKIESANVLSWGNFRSKAIKKKVKTGLFSSKRVTIAYKYYFTIDLAICWGKIDIIQIESGNHKLTNAPWTSGGYYEINKPNIYGEEGGAKSGVIFDCSFYNGADSYPNFADRVEPLYPEVEATAPSAFLRGSYPNIFDAEATEQDSHIGSSRRPGCEGVARLALDGYVGNTTNIRAIKITARHIPAGVNSAYDYIGGDANPASILYFVLTNKERGLGLSINDINVTKIEAAAETLYNENLGMSLRWTQDISAEKLIQTICEHIDATYYTDLATGQFTIELIRARDDYSEVTTFTSEEIKEISNIERSDTNDIINELKVKFIDRASNWKENVVIASNTAAYYYAGRVISQSQSFSGLSNEQSALLVANRKLQQLSAAPASITIKTTTSKGMTNGQLAKINYPERGINNFVGRITEIDHGTLEKPEVQLKLLEDVFTTRLAQFDTIPESNWVPEQAATPGQLAELYLYIELTPAIADEPSLLFLAPAPSKASDFRLYQNDIEVGETVIYEQSNLEIGIGKGDTVLNLENALALDTATSAEILQGKNLAILTDHVNFEWIAFRGSSAAGQMESLERGLLDTIPQAWPAGTRVYLFNEMDVISITPNGTQTIEVTALNGPVESEAVSTIQTAQDRFNAATPPEMIINGERYPDEIADNGDLIVNLNTRDNTMIHLNGNTIRDDGRTYTIRIKTDGVTRFTEQARSVTKTQDEVLTASGGSFDTVTVEAETDDNIILSHTFSQWGDLAYQQVSISLTNPDAETGDTTGWTDEITGVGIKNAASGYPVPFGTYCFFGGTVASSRASQTIETASITGLLESDIDSGTANLRIDWQQSSHGGLDSARMGVRFLDNEDTLLSEEPADMIATSATVWTARNLKAIIPVSTRKIVIYQEYERGAGTESNGSIDEIAATVLLPL